MGDSPDTDESTAPGAQTVRDEYAGGIETLASILGTSASGIRIVPAGEVYLVAGDGHSDVVENTNSDGYLDAFIAENREAMESLTDAFGVRQRDIDIRARPDGGVSVEVRNVRP